MSVEYRQQRRQEGKDEPTPKQRRVLNQPSKNGNPSQYLLKHYLMMDRASVCPNITRDMLKVYLDLPMKKDPSEPGLFDKIINKDKTDKTDVNKKVKVN